MALIQPKYTSLARLTTAQLDADPDQTTFFRKRFANVPDDEFDFLEFIASKIERLIGGALSDYARDYLWLCEELLEEELYFRRYGRYRYSKFQEAFDNVYSNDGYMKRYMNAVLLTQLWWSNHSKILEFYASHFLAGNAARYSHLEIGPGHGLFLYLAANDPRSGDLEGWDVSATSVALTRSALETLETRNKPMLRLVNIFDGPDRVFDSITLSEVLEHIEEPRRALDTLRNLLKPTGRLFVNMPINSPAPDHLFNVGTPEELEQFIVESGFRVLDRALFPATNQSMELARAKKLTISCGFILARA